MEMAALVACTTGSSVEHAKDGVAFDVVGIGLVVVVVEEST